MKLKPLLSLSVLLIAGCASGPARKSVPMPPTPPDMTKVVKRSAARFAPAAAVPEERPVYIGVWSATHYYVLGVQTNTPGGSMKFSMSPNVTGPWQFIADPGWLAQGETAMIHIPRNWLPERRLFACVQTAATPQPTALRAIGGQDSGQTFVWKGKRYRLIRMSPPEAQMPVFRLRL